MKKDLYGVAYVITSILILGAIFYYQFQVRKDTVDSFEQKDLLIQLSARQEMLSQQIAKSAVGMGYAMELGGEKAESNYLLFQRQLERLLPEWEKVHIALKNGDDDLGLAKPTESNEYSVIRKELDNYERLILQYGRELAVLPFAADTEDPNYIKLRESISYVLSYEDNYLMKAKESTDYFYGSSQDAKDNFATVEIVALGSLVILFIAQGFVIFRPLWRLANENYQTANKAFIRVKKSEQELRISYEKQKKANKQLLISRHQLAANLKRLKESEGKLLKSTQEQIEINDKLISAQGELKDAYSKVQKSEEEVRQMAEKQLEDNEKLFFAEKQVKEALELEKKRREELNLVLENLKGAQSQLVHSEKMASLGQLTAGIAHEINNPINFISSGMKSIEFTIDAVREILSKYDQLENGIDKAEQILKEVRELKEDHEYEEIMSELDVMIRDVNYGVTRTIEIVKGLRVFSRLDEEEMKRANINENLDATLVLLRNKTKNRVKLSKFYDEKMHEIDCYPGQLNQVFMNIINNAIQAIPEEKEDGEISLYTEETPDEIIVRIKDNGVGIPEEVKGRIWEPFFTTKAVGVGTGLGMSISYSIIEKHHGKIQLESEVGKGTEFIISIPRVAKDMVKNKETVASSTNN
jgi:signal transduction histidine kinase